jgi:hypothetical protein
MIVLLRLAQLVNRGAGAIARRSPNAADLLEIAGFDTGRLR